MGVFVFSADRRIPVVPGVPIVVGRDESCDLVVAGGRVSRRHLTVTVEDDEWTITDTSANGLFGSKGRVMADRGAGLACFALGSPTGPVVVLSPDPHVDVAAVIADFQPQGLTSPAPDSQDTGVRMLEGVTRFGRASDNDVVLSGALASAQHAHVRRGSTGLEVIDLASERGTFVNGERVSRRSLQTGDRVTMGGSAFTVTAEGTLLEARDSSGVSLDARNVNVQIGPATLLHDVSFHLPARSVLAVVGQSGSGKSTLLGALTGFRPATAGTALVGGRDLYAEYDELRFQVGLVPQQDLVPAQLKVREALDYAARLRFPQDTTASERRERVREVMDDLGLTQPDAR